MSLTTAYEFRPTCDSCSARATFVRYYHDRRVGALCSECMATAFPDVGPSLYKLLNWEVIPGLVAETQKLPCPGYRGCRHE